MSDGWFKRALSKVIYRQAHTSLKMFMRLSNALIYASYSARELGLTYEISVTNVQVKERYTMCSLRKCLPPCVEGKMKCELKHYQPR